MDLPIIRSLPFNVCLLVKGLDTPSLYYKNVFLSKTEFRLKHADALSSVL